MRKRIEKAALQAGRRVDSITLLGVTKGHPAATIRAASEAGLTDFGESYLQEALDKITALTGSNDAPGVRSGGRPADMGALHHLTWHFIGRMQANKTRPVAERFAWVHAVDRLRIAERLCEQRPYYAPPLNVCLQVNVAGEVSKGGVGFAELPALAAAVGALPRLKLRGLMCLPPEEEDPERQRHWFRKLREAFEELNRTGLGLDTLSMGMSGDFEAAIAEGATLVRVGTALFGPRPRPGEPLP
ncbi:MAG TPA: YggS family pyridoxal phosphate-dependent enzyme [Steroidobacteraceae bacterium]